MHKKARATSVGSFKMSTSSNGNASVGNESGIADPKDSNNKIYLNFNKATVSDSGSEAMSQASISFIEPKRKNAAKSQIRANNPYQH